MRRKGLKRTGAAALAAVMLAGGLGTPLHAQASLAYLEASIQRAEEEEARLARELEESAARAEKGQAVADYARQFVGNPYVYGGTSLTNGCDCSGFVLAVYASFDISLPHSSASDRSQGTAVDGGLENAQPGDIVCYSGHVAIYLGENQIVHAFNSRVGIVISDADYQTPLAVRRMF